ncbi:uncharacterized protein B0I36DRAFT_375712 [Microdochium trichocladiopsis]|uniref:NAD(P)-binding protein n=1 Tax=Microdochium trichocladiopsis TaxID=1682393 RepID=A0A9P9BP46_9PEZI|nr:uncharacterized protein B0I36DRAFT_375712 [Microdochium trichocladiopsis]KAH7028164.1 hypothetical protein B0I36DRAFT_375712 [Microdochium trichocladiopsis]
MKRTYTNTQTLKPSTANTGLGYEVVKALAATSHAYKIILGCRDPSKGDAAVAKIKSEVPETASSFSVVQIDIASDESIEAAVASLTSTEPRIDVLVNNAGAHFEIDATKNLRPDGIPSAAAMRRAFNQSWNVNVAGTQVLTALLVPLLLKSPDPRLLFLTSGTASLTETEKTDGPIYGRINAHPKETGWPKPAGSLGEGKPSGLPSAYKSVKVGLNMVMREWARVLRADGVKVWSISPGFLATGLGGVGADALRKLGAKEPHEGGEFIRDVVEGKYDHEEGKAIRATGPQPW